jgi:pyruvate carboxylase
MHAHDTWGSGVANTLQAVKMGIRTVDASIAGLGGCPYAPGATGNVSTEDVVYALHNSGYETGVDLAKAAVVGQWISVRVFTRARGLLLMSSQDQIDRKNISRVGFKLLCLIRSDALMQAGPAQLAKSRYTAAKLQVP